MIRNHSQSGPRSAFTLVELMVVILIIAILVSLISSAVFKVMQKIPEVTTRTEISEMEVALRAFMTDYGLTEPPPSLLLLNENVGPTTTFTGPYSPGDPSYAFLTKVFGKNLIGTGPTPPAGIPPFWVDWNGDGIPTPGAAILEGEQCLVFYLGGIPYLAGNVLPSPQGFSTNNMNPSQPLGKRKGPYYTFQTARLVPGYPIVSTKLNVFPVYIDAWQVKLPATMHAAPFANGVPYAYFSSLGQNNSGYSRLYPYVIPTNLNACQSIGAAPYWTVQNALGVPTVFTNSNTYQIISAGKDGTFGGGLWLPSSGAGGAGADDQANFSGGLLGNGQQ